MKREVQEHFGDVFKELVGERGMSSSRLAEHSGIPEKTIDSWREGRVKRPRNVVDILRVSKALRLTESELNRLLTSARHHSLDTLRRNSTNQGDQALLDLLAFWKSERPHSEPSLSVPFQALSKIKGFVGRESEIETISTNLKKGGSICIIHGMGGVGKSTLANHLAYQLRNQFKDGVLWATLSDKPSSDAQIMNILRDFAKAYEVDVKEDIDIESRSRTVRNLLSSKNTLIVLDNALGTEDVQHLLPSNDGSCSVLITTRNSRMLRDRADFYPLKSLGQEEGLTLLRQIVGQERIDRELEGAIEIIEFVGGLPLALRIVGSTIFEASVITLKEYSEMLEDERSRLEHLVDWDDVSKNVQASIELSYARLKPAEQELLSQLALFAGHNFSVEAIVALTQLLITVIKLRLGRCQSLSLLEWVDDETPKSKAYQVRYHFHPLIHAFVRDKLGDAPVILKKRLADYYAEFVQLHGQSAYEALDADWENIEVAAHWAHENDWNTTLIQLTEGVTQLNLGSLGFLDARGYWREGREWLTWCLESSSIEEDQLATASCYLKQGTFAFHLADFEPARNALLQSHAIINEPMNEPEAICHAYTCEMLSRLAAEDGLEDMLDWSVLGIEQLEPFDSVEANQLRGYLLVRQSSIWGESGDINSADKMVRKGLSLLPGYPTVARVNAYTSLGAVAYFSDRYDEAEMCCKLALSDAEYLGDVRRTADLRRNLGGILTHRGDFFHAIQHYENAIEQYRRIGSVSQEFDAVANVASVLRVIGREDKAKEYLESAIIKVEKYPIESEIFLWFNRARLQIYIEQLTTAEDDLERAKALVTRRSDRPWPSMIAAAKAQIAFLNQQMTEANKQIEYALRIGLDDYAEEKGIALRTKGDILAFAQQYEEAMDAYRESESVLETSSRFELTRSQVAIAILQRKQDQSINIEPSLQSALSAFEEMQAKREIRKVEMLLAGIESG